MYICVCIHKSPLCIYIYIIYCKATIKNISYVYMSRTNLGSEWLGIWTSPSTAEPSFWDLQTFSVNDKWLGGTIGCHIWQWQTSSKAIHKTHLVSPPKGSLCGGRKAKRGKRRKLEKINQTIHEQSWHYIIYESLLSQVLLTMSRN